MQLPCVEAFGMMHLQENYSNKAYCIIILIPPQVQSFAALGYCLLGLKTPET